MDPLGIDAARFSTCAVYTLPTRQRSIRQQTQPKNSTVSAGEYVPDANHGAGIFTYKTD